MAELAVSKVPTEAPPGKVLIVEAHPDDETLMTGVVYKLAHIHYWTVDLLCVTNGEGGYAHSQAAEIFYGIQLTKEEVARAHLPRIRRAELMTAGQILGIRKFFFMDEVDDKYSKDLSIPMKNWNTKAVTAHIAAVVTRERYDFVFVLLPHPETHAHHKCATILALEAVQSLPAEIRPAVLAFPDVIAATQDDFDELPGQPLTRLAQKFPLALFDRNQKLLGNPRLNYNLIARWVEAAHKSQGSLSFENTPFVAERLYSFAINGPEAAKKIQRLIAQLTQ